MSSDQVGYCECFIGSGLSQLSGYLVSLFEGGICSKIVGEDIVWVRSSHESLRDTVLHLNLYVDYLIQ